MASSGQQLALPINLEVEASFENYYLPESSPNMQATRCLYQMAHGRGEAVAFLWGVADVGLSHLLRACARQANDQSLRACYLKLSAAQSVSSDFFAGLGEPELACIDDVDYIAGHQAHEQALFHWFNSVRDRGGRIIFASHTPPNQMALSLADLHSRLLSGPVYELEPLGDEDKTRALQLQSHQLGMQLTGEVAQFIVRHCPRGMAALFAVLKQLDCESLASQRRVTIPFIKQALGL